MPSANVDLPADATTIFASLVYLDKGGVTDIGYLQRVRSMKSVNGNLLSDIEKRYLPMVPTWSERLASQVSGPIDAVVSPPSRFPHFPEPYRNAIKHRFAEAADLTPFFTRSCGQSSGEGAPFIELMGAVYYAPNGAESDYHTLVIVDDILATGRTAALVVSKIRAAGLPHGARIIIAAPLWLPTKSARARAAT